MARGKIWLFALAFPRRLWQCWYAAGESGSGKRRKEFRELPRPLRLGSEGGTLLVRPIDVANALRRRKREPLLITERGRNRAVFNLTVGDIVGIYGDIAREQLENDVRGIEDARSVNSAGSNA